VKVAASFAACVLVLFVASCGEDDDSFERPETVGETELLPRLMTTEQVRGTNRFTFQLLDKDSQNVPDAEVMLRTAFLGEEDSAELGEPIMATYDALELEALNTVVEHVHADGSLHTHSTPFGEGLYAATLEFDRAGQWGIEFNVGYRDEDQQIPVVVNVLEDGSAPGIGDPAPATTNYTAADHELADISSDPSPDPDLYQRTVADALESGDVFVVAFATPAFCHSRVCAPVLEAVKEAKANLPEASYIHIEPFENLEDPQNLRDSPFVDEWRLPNEPWVFVVSRDGLIAAAFEGPFTVDELEKAVRAALAA
jgi:hypothetical protein